MGFPTPAMWVTQIERIRSTVNRAKEVAAKRREAEMDDKTPPETAVPVGQPAPTVSPINGGGGGGGGGTMQLANENGKRVSVKTWVIVGAVTLAVIVGTVAFTRRKAAT